MLVNERLFGSRFSRRDGLCTFFKGNPKSYTGINGATVYLRNYFTWIVAKLSFHV